MATYEELMIKARELQAAGQTENAKRVAQIAVSKRGETQQAPAREMAGPPVAPPPQTNMVEQSMSGVNEGIGYGAGMPVDLMTGALNMGGRGINALAGTNIPQIENPVGGSQWFNEGILDPTISDVEPQNAAQRYGRRVGQEVGAMAIPAGATMRGAKAMLPMAGMEMGSAVGAGLAGQTSREIAPDNDMADMAASMIGGLSPIGASRAMRAAPKAPSLDNLRAQQKAAYGRVEQSGAELTPQSSSALAYILKRRIADEGVPEFLPPSVRSVGSKIDALPQGAKITDVEDLRRRIGNDVAGSADGQARRIGVDLKRETDSYLQGLDINDLTSGSPKDVIDDLTQGRELTGRIARADMLGGETGAVTKALRRASRTGTGGNQVNAIRQNIGQILDNPKKRRGFKPAEIAAMEKINDGTGVTNALRLGGRLSPSSGAAPLAGGLGSAAAFGSVGLIPPMAGFIAKGGAEALTMRQIRMLDELIRNGAPLAAKRASSSERGALAALIAARVSNGAEKPKP